MSNNTIPAAPVAAPMWGEEVPVRERFARSVAALTFHPDDVPEFGWADVMEVLRDLLVDEFDWDVVGPRTVSWGDSRSRRYFEVRVDGFRGVSRSRSSRVARSCSRRRSLALPAR
jgi:hypothetical protein